MAISTAVLRRGRRATDFVVSPVIFLALSRAVTYFLAAGAMLELVHLSDDATFAVQDLITLEGVA